MGILLPPAGDPHVTTREHWWRRDVARPQRIAIMAARRLREGRGRGYLSPWRAHPGVDAFTYSQGMPCHVIICARCFAFSLLFIRKRPITRCTLRIQNALKPITKASRRLRTRRLVGTPSEG